MAIIQNPSFPQVTMKSIGASTVLHIGLLLLVLMSTTLDASQEIQAQVQQSEEPVHLERRSASKEACDRFVHYPNHLSYLGGELIRVGDGYTAEECQQACLTTTSFTCTAVQIHKPATCFITGYKLRNDFYSVHFQRTCQHGPNCFVPIEGKSGGFTDFISISPYLRSSQEAQALYCMAQCEQMDACVGFDLPRNRNSLRCAFLAMHMTRHSHFDLYLKRC